MIDNKFSFRPFQMYSCQQVLVAQNSELIAILTFLCEQSHKLTNMGIYYARQLYFKSQKGIGKYDLEKVYKKNNHYKVLHSFFSTTNIENRS